MIVLLIIALISFLPVILGGLIFYYGFLSLKYLWEGAVWVAPYFWIFIKWSVVLVIIAYIYDFVEGILKKKNKENQKKYSKKQLNKWADFCQQRIDKN